MNYCSFYKNVFVSGFFPRKNYFSSKRPAGSLICNFDTFADIFLPEARFFHADLKKTPLKNWTNISNCLCFFQRENSAEKIPLDRKNVLLTIGWSFIVKVRHFSAQVLKHFRKLLPV